MKKQFVVMFALTLVAAAAQAQQTIISFQTMVGVHGGFVKHNPIRGVRGDYDPWVISSANGSLTTDGHLTMSVRGVIFANGAPNDEPTFRALVSCLSDDGHGSVSTVNVTTAGFPATPTGDSDIDTTVALPKQCVAPIIFVMSGSEDVWFAVTGAD
jgi:hypothetical protein